MKRLRLIAALIVLPAISLAHEGATGIVKERMDAMTQAGKAVKSISDHIQANRNLGSIKDDALTIEANAGRIPSWFPPGSDQKPTDAKPEIWSHWDDFTARAAQLKDESAKLAAAAETGDPGAIGTQFRAVGRVCSGCHDQYRAKH